MAIINIPSLPAGFLDIILLAALLIIGILIIVLIVEVLLYVLPAAIVGVIVWFLTGSLFLAGIAFLIVALISILGRS